MTTMRPHRAVGGDLRADERHRTARCADRTSEELEEQGGGEAGPRAMLGPAPGSGGDQPPKRSGVQLRFGTTGGTALRSSGLIVFVDSGNAWAVLMPVL